MYVIKSIKWISLSILCNIDILFETRVHRNLSNLSSILYFIILLFFTFYNNLLLS